MDTPVVDIHCHTFNGDDLPVRGFISHVGPSLPLGGVLARLLDAVLQAGAPGYEAERSRLDALVGEEQLAETLGVAAIAPDPALTTDPREDLAAETDRALRELSFRSQPLLEQVDEAMSSAYPSVDKAIKAEEFAFPSAGGAKRAVSWVLLYGRYRLELTQLLIANFGGRVDLFCPLSVDLGTALGDVAKTTGRQQMELQEKISRLSMLGKLPRGGKARVHPFVAFDPLHEVRARVVGDLETPLDLVKVAVQTYGFVGVKVYPPMGWRPIGNARLGLLPAEFGERLDAVLRDFYGWCEQEDVPITTHCNRSNFADPKLADLAGPPGWIDVLGEFPRLHLNLGHFGGMHPSSDQGPGHDWPQLIAEGAGHFEHLYADVGNHPISDTGLVGQYRKALDAMFKAPQTAAIRERIMFGSDWFMEALHPEADQFLAQWEAFFDHWGAADKQGFLGGRALRFLGFDDAQNRNAQRLIGRYERYAKDRTPAWLTSG
jgi:predicted TIM-barrel fold metal-dependent hydrolase